MLSRHCHISLLKAQRGKAAQEMGRQISEDLRSDRTVNRPEKRFGTNEK